MSDITTVVSSSCFPVPLGPRSELFCLCFYAHYLLSKVAASTFVSAEL